MAKQRGFDDLQFLDGGGEMGELIREKDWSKTPLGDPAGWPQSLRTMVSVMLDNPFGMYIAWGPGYTQLYNDGYRPILGTTKHPQALGISTRETFAEIWHIIASMFDDVMKGKAVGFPDFMLPLNRNGFVEECYFDFSYSPIRKENGEVGGVLVTVIETTNKKKAEDNLKESEERFRTMAENIPNLAWMAKADGWIYWYNKKWYEYTGTTPEQMEGWGWQSVHDAEELPRVMEKWKSSIESGQEFEMVFPLKGADGKFRPFLTRVVPVKDDEGKIRQWFGSNTDITEQKKIELVLKESELRFRNTVKQAPVGITILRGKEFTVEMANDAYMQLVDRNITEFVGRPLFESLPEVEESVHALLNKVLNTGEPYHGNEVPIPVNRYGKQELCYFDFLYYPLKEEDGRISGIIVTVTEVTEKVTARKKIEESEERFHNLIYSSPSAIGILYGKDLVITIANDAIIEIWGKGKEIVGKAYFEALPELIEQGYKEVFARVYKTGVPFNAVETPVQLVQHGVMQQKYYNFLLFPQRNINGEIDGIGIIATEVTSQALLNNKVKESEKRFRLLADSMPQHIWTSDIEGKLNYFNRSVFDYSGLTPEQISKDGWIQIVHPDDREENIKQWLDAISSGKDFLFEHRFRRHDGMYRWMLSRAHPQKDENGRIQMWVGTSTDIQNLKELDRQKDSFLSMASHELKTPVTTIKAYGQVAESMLAKKGDTEILLMVTKMGTQVNRLTNLIGDLLDITKLQKGKLRFNEDIINFSELVKEVVDDMQKTSTTHEIKINAVEEVKIYGDKDKLSQVLNNLISNAIKYSPKANSIIVNTQQKENGVELSVKDFGIGIPGEEQTNVFEQFYRVNGNNQSTFPGMGIGLFICSEIIKMHWGKIWIDSAVGNGSTFYIWLPLDHRTLLVK